MEKDWTFSHVGIIVRDINKTLAYYKSLGVFTIPKEIPFVMEGKKATMSGAHIFLGPMWIEVFQPISGNTLQQKFLEAHGEGINHIGFEVADIAKEREYMASKNVPVAYHILDSSTYYNVAEYGNLFVELHLGHETPESIARGIDPGRDVFKHLKKPD
jgi:catechol 2,3-dioxygenase-like lactoylglutathione lyase family enzyme